MPNKDSLREADLKKKVRRIFSSRVHNYKKFEVVSEDGGKTIVAPYESTIDKILTILTSHIEEAERAARIDELESVPICKDQETQTMVIDQRLKQLKSQKGGK